MKTRATTGFFFILVMLASLFSGPAIFISFFVLLGLLSLNEFYGLIRSASVYPQRLVGILLGLAFSAPIALHLLCQTSIAWLLLAVPFSVLVLIAELFSKKAHPFHNISFTFFGVLYAVIPFCLYTAMAFIDGSYNWHLSLGFLLLLWGSDTGAYLFGRKLGKNKLFERHSPGKTWEGFIGGMFTSILISFILSTQFTEIHFLHWAVISIIIVIGGTLGDLSESMLKRSLKVKDSGSLLPGHGGLLDRFDGLLLSAPLVYVYLYLIFSI